MLHICGPTVTCIVHPLGTGRYTEGVYEIVDSSETAPKMDEVKTVITLRSGKKVEQLMPKPLDEDIEGQDEEPEKIVIKEDMMKKSMPPPFPQALRGKRG